MRGNQILFYHNFMTKVNYEILKEYNINNDINTYLYSNKDELNRLAKRAYVIYKLYLQKNILKQQFTLKITNLYFKKFE